MNIQQLISKVQRRESKNSYNWNILSSILKQKIALKKIYINDDISIEDDMFTEYGTEDDYIEIPEDIQKQIDEELDN